ncbi:Uncharacterised protein [Mycobacteroides abscessus subsp. abscessus]|nr:Uncharacterised protein [Mycobacteroides abscessus subsp. abscessus]
MVELERSPTSCAVLMTSIHSDAGSLPLVSTQRISSSRISAAVPGMVSRPAARSSVSQSRTLWPPLEAPLTISMGLKACTCMLGTRFFTARTRSAYPVTGSSGSMPPCMQTSVAPATYASQARSPTSSADSENASASPLRCANAQNRQPV